MAASTPRSTRRDVRLPLWLKLGALFGGLMAAVVGLTGWSEYSSQLRTRTAEREQRLVHLAEALAGQVDGDAMGTFRASADMQRPEYKQLHHDLNWIMEANQIHWIGVYGRDGDRTYYVVDADSGNPLPLNYPMFEAWAELSRAFAGEPSFGEGLVDDYGTWDAAFAPVFTTDKRVVGVVSAQESTAWRQLMAGHQVNVHLREFGLGALGALLAAIFFARMISRNLQTLADGATAVAGGDLNVHVEIHTRDEVGVVADAFNDMVRGLRERDTIRDAFGRFVTEEMAHRILADPDALAPGGDLRRVTILMSDLRGFTSLSERFQPAEMIALLNDYLGRMSDVVDRRGGTVIEFIGDAVLAVFGAPFLHDDDPLRAVSCAVEMQVEMERFNADHANEGIPALEMGIGVHTGRVIVGNIGSQTRMKYGLVGDAVNLTARVESFTVGGEVLVSTATRNALNGQVAMRGPIEVNAKGKKDPVLLYAVQSVLEPEALHVPAEHGAEEELRSVAVRLTWRRVHGTAVDAERLEGDVLALGTKHASVSLADPVERFDNVQLTLQPTGAREIDNVYAKVQSVDEVDGRWVARLRFTSMPHGAGARLGQIASA